MKQTFAPGKKTLVKKAIFPAPAIPSFPAELKRALVFKYGSLQAATKALGVSRMGLYKVLSGKVKNSHRVAKVLISDLLVAPETLARPKSPESFESKPDKKRPPEMSLSKLTKSKKQGGKHESQGSKFK